MPREFNNIVRYVKEETASFQEKPLNSIDALVLNQFLYAKIEAVLDGDGVDRLTAGYSMKDFWRNEYVREEFNDGITDAQNLMLVSAIAASRRFRNIKVKNVVSVLSFDLEEQFAAAGFELDDGTDFVSFRGTDGTLMGWREDFALSFMEEVPAQRAAVEYINRFYGPGTEGENKRIYVGGHSKGGNLAIYGSCFCDAEARARIIRTYSLDGPGFRKEVAERITEVINKDKLEYVKLVPQSSVIGMLLQSQNYIRVIKSKGLGGLQQHSAFQWVIEDGDFIYLDDMSYAGAKMDRTVSDWLEKADDDLRERFTDAIFGTMFDNGIKTVNDLKHLSASEIAGMLTSIKEMDESTKDAVGEMFGNFLKASIEQIKKD